MIEITGVEQRFDTPSGSIQALTSVDLSIRENEFVTLVGRSGCGKSTLLRIIAGLQKPTGGRVSVGGDPVLAPRQDVSMMFQRPALLPWRNVVQNISLQLEMRKLPAARYETRLRELIKLSGLEGFEHCLPHELSGGMQQRVALCRALIHDPDILLMDEPFGALDAMTREAMNLELQRVWLESRKTVMFITHSISEAVFLSDRVVVMSKRPGRVALTIDVDLPRPRDYTMVGHPDFVKAATAIRECFDAAGMTE